MTDHRFRLLHGNESEVHALAARLDDAAIQIVLPPGQPSFSHQVLALTLVDLLARLFPRIHVECDLGAVSDPRLPPGPQSLHDRFGETRERGGLPLNNAVGVPDVTIRIGPTEEYATLYVDGFGWESYVGRVPSRLSPAGADNVPLGSLAAACRAAAAIFERILRPSVPQPPPSVYASLLTFTASENPIGRGDALRPVVDAVLVGAGSIGGAAVYSFAHVPELHGKLVVVDPQDLEAHNHVRAILVSAADSGAERTKVALAVTALAHQDHLQVEPHKVTVTGYHATLNREHALPTILSAVDSASSRRAIQDCLPLEVVNAACHPHEVTVSGHSTGDGPCVCCLHMRDVLDARRIRMRLIAHATGMNEPMVAELMAQRAPLNPQQLRWIARHRGYPDEALGHFAGRTLDDLWREELLYGAAEISTDGGSAVAVAAPFVTALAGVLLAGEVLKRGDPDLRANALGPHGPAIKYEENPYASPFFASLSNPSRWPGSECLCRSTRRMRLLAERYGLSG